jgi:hypothetical protein
MSDIICLKCGKHLRDVEEARTHKCTDSEQSGEYQYTIRDESFKKRYKSSSPLPKEEIYGFKPPPPAPPLLIEEPERPKSHGSLITLIVWLSIAFVLGLAVIAWAYLAS